MDELVRYNRITEKMPREFCLLQGLGCKWQQCTFCDYFHDVSENPFEVNREVLEQVTGEFGVLDIINSGSCTELDEETLRLIQHIVRQKGIHTIWFEAHYMYREGLADFAAGFPDGVEVKFRTGIETFDPALRRAWKKGIAESVTPEDIARYFRGVCLLFAVSGQSRETISADLKTALKYFDYFSVNAFVENTTPLKRDEALVSWFEEEWFPILEREPRAEILLNNTDLGVG